MYIHTSTIFIIINIYYFISHTSALFNFPVKNTAMIIEVDPKILKGGEKKHFKYIYIYINID